MFYLNDQVWCPNCKPVFNKRWERIGESLECIEDNYSGCTVDIGYCEACKKHYEVSYKVDKIIEINR